MIYLLKSSPFNEEFSLHGYATNEAEIRLLAEQEADWLTLTPPLSTRVDFDAGRVTVSGADDAELSLYLVKVNKVIG